MEGVFCCVIMIVSIVSVCAHGAIDHVIRLSEFIVTTVAQRKIVTALQAACRTKKNSNFESLTSLRINSGESVRRVMS